MALDVEIPGMGESVSEVILIGWLKDDGERGERDEPICVLETDKANVDLPSPASGTLKHLQALEATLEIGAVIAQIEEGAAPSAPTAQGDVSPPSALVMQEEAPAPPVAAAAGSEAAAGENSAALRPAGRPSRSGYPTGSRKPPRDRPGHTPPTRPLSREREQTTA